MKNYIFKQKFLKEIFSIARMFNQNDSLLEQNYLEFNMLNDTKIEMNPKVIDNEYSNYVYDGIMQYNQDGNGFLHLDKDSQISQSIYRDSTLSLTILKPQRYWPYTELKHLCIYILRDIVTLTSQKLINQNDVEVTPRCYKQSVFFNQLLVQKPEGNIQLFFVIRNDLKIGLLTFNLDTLTFKDETNFNQVWKIPQSELSTVCGVKSFMRHALQNIIVLSTLNNLYVYNLETDWQHGYIVNLQGVFDFVKFFSYSGYTDITIKDFLVWKGSIITMCITYFDSYKQNYYSKIVFIYMDLSENFNPVLLASIDLNKLLHQKGKIKDSDFKIFLSDKHTTLVFIGRVSKSMKFFSLEHLFLNPVTFGQDLSPIDEYKFNVLFNFKEDDQLNLVSQGENLLISAIGDEFLTIISYANLECIVAIDIYGNIYSPIVRTTCTEIDDLSLKNNEYIPLNLIYFNKPDYGVIAKKKDGKLQLDQYYFKNGVNVRQLPIISKRIPDQLSYMLEFSDAHENEFVHDMILKTQTNDLIDILPENNTLEVRMWNEYKISIHKIVKGFVEKYSLKCVDEDTYYELNYDMEKVIYCKNVRIQVANHFQKLYDYTDFLDVGYDNHEFTLESDEDENYYQDRNSHKQSKKGKIDPDEIRFIKSSGRIKDLPALRFILHSQLSILMLSSYTRVIYSLQLFRLRKKVITLENGDIKYKLEKSYQEISKCDTILFVGRDLKSQSFIIFLFCGGIFTTRKSDDGPSSQVIAAILPFSFLQKFQNLSVNDLHIKIKTNNFNYDLKNYYTDLQYIEIPDMDKDLRSSMELKEKLRFNEKFLVMPKIYYVGPYTKSFLTILEVKYNISKSLFVNCGINTYNFGENNCINFHKEIEVTFDQMQKIYGEFTQQFINFEEIDNTLNYLIGIFPPYDFAITYDKDFTKGHNEGILSLFIFSNSQDQMIYDSRVLVYELNKNIKTFAKIYSIKRSDANYKNIHNEIIPYFMAQDSGEISLITIANSDYIYQYKLDFSLEKNQRNQKYEIPVYKWQKVFQYEYSGKTKEALKFDFYQAGNYTLMQFHQSLSSYEEKIYLYDTNRYENVANPSSQPQSVLSEFMAELSYQFYYLDTFELEGNYNVTFCVKLFWNEIILKNFANIFTKFF